MFTQAPKRTRILMSVGFSVLVANQAVAQMPQGSYRPFPSNAAPAPDLYNRPYVSDRFGTAGGSGGPVYYYGPYDAYRYPGLGVWNPGPVYYSEGPYGIDIQSGLFPRNQGLFNRPRNRYGWW